MPPTTNWTDCKRFAGAITAVGGTVPDTLANLLSAQELLARPRAAPAPETDILDHALAGTLDTKTLDKLIDAAALAQLRVTYTADLARRSEHTLLGQWHRVMETAADQILDSLRERFNEHAQSIAHARSLINPESSAEHVIESGQPELVTAWQGLNVHLKVVSKIGAIASQFGPRLGNFPQITEYANSDNFRLADAAIMCTAGNLETDSALFHRPDPGHRGSPWARIALKLHSIESARARYNEWAADQFDRQHSGPLGGWIDEHGKVHEFPRPNNPYRQEANVT